MWRSVGAVLAGWVTVVGGSIAVMFLLAIGLGQYQPPYGTGYLVLALLVDFVAGVAGGFVTGVIARRKEVTHAVALWVTGLVLARYLLGYDGSDASTPGWHMIAGHISGFASVLLGGWLRARHRVLLESGSKAIAIATDHLQFPVALVAGALTFVFALIYAAAGADWIVREFFSMDDPKRKAVPLCLLTIPPSVLVTRYVFRWIAGTNRREREPGRDLTLDELGG